MEEGEVSLYSTNKANSPPEEDNLLFSSLLIIVLIHTAPAGFGRNEDVSISSALSGLGQ